jgi:ATP-dependent Clp protease ATP-binding subunit ClpC
MNTVPPDLQQILSFFQLQHLLPNSESLGNCIARIHGLILASMNHFQISKVEEHLLNGDPVLGAYREMIAGENGSEETSLSVETLADFIKLTLGSQHEFKTDAQDQVRLLQQNKSTNLFPFFFSKAGSVWWAASYRPAVITYTNSNEDLLPIDAANPSFEAIIDGFLDRGWYRLALKALEGLPEHRQKHFENKTYSAHCFLACEHYKTRRYNDAVQEFEKAMRIKSSMPQLYYNLALSYARLKSYNSAIRLLNQLNRIKPNQAKTFDLLGDFYFHLNDWDRCMALYQKAMELAENKADISGKIRRLEEKLPKTKDGKKEEEKEDRFSIQNCLQDLTMEAELGKFQPVFGREPEILQMQEILACQSKKNVLILGDPGVGKTAVIQELAYRIISGRVSPRLHGKKLIRVNMGALLAGAKFRGQFEERLMQLIREAKKMSCILFIDDIHQIASGSANKPSSMEASHFLKPALINDEIQIIGATNLEEFRNSLEKDNSFLRCFQLIKLEEPDHETLWKILRNARSTLENYHRVIIKEESLETILMWVKVLLRDRALPDKALDLLDRAAARISIEEKSAIVTAESVLETISEISRVPLSRMSVSEVAHYKNVETILTRRVVGQTGAIHTVAKVLRTSKLRMNLNPVRPKGIFLFVGPTGVGKTELAKAMAEFSFGQEDKIVRIDMSEYMERYSASRLIGTSPGYVGYYDQNQLVDKIRANPYSLILLDEIEKADPQLLSIFLQVFDAGRLTDGKGKVAYFDNTTIVMTSNIGTHLFAQNKLGYGSEQALGHVTRSDLFKEVKKFFQPEFLNRIDEIVFFQPLTLENVREIALMKLRTIVEQLRQQNKELVLQNNAMLELCRSGYDYEYGARNLERVLRRQILDRLSELALRDDWPTVRKISVELEQEEIVLKALKPSGVQEMVDSTVEEQNFLLE